MTEVVHLTDPGQIVMAYAIGEITREGAIGALVQGGRTVTEAKSLLSITPWLPIEYAPKDGTEVELFWPAIGDSPRIRQIGRWSSPKPGYLPHWNFGSVFLGDDPTHFRRIDPDPEV